MKVVTAEGTAGWDKRLRPADSNYPTTKTHRPFAVGNVGSLYGLKHAEHRLQQVYLYRSGCLRTRGTNPPTAWSKPATGGLPSLVASALERCRESYAISTRSCPWRGSPRSRQTLQFVETPSRKGDSRVRIPAPHKWFPTSSARRTA